MVIDASCIIGPARQKPRLSNACAVHMGIADAQRRGVQHSATDRPFRGEVLSEIAGRRQGKFIAGGGHFTGIGITDPFGLPVFFIEQTHGPRRVRGPGGRLVARVPYAHSPVHRLSRRQRLAVIDNMRRFPRNNLAAVPQVRLSQSQQLRRRSSKNLIRRLFPAASIGDDLPIQARFHNTNGKGILQIFHTQAYRCKPAVPGKSRFKRPFGRRGKSKYNPGTGRHIYHRRKQHLHTPCSVESAYGTAQACNDSKFCRLSQLPSFCHTEAVFCSEWTAKIL